MIDQKGRYYHSDESYYLIVIDALGQPRARLVYGRSALVTDVNK